MEKSKLIIVEGPQGSGKTTVTDFIRDALKHTNLYRLNGISDATKTGYEKSKKMYDILLNYLKNMENLNINLLFDRTFFTEENYCRLGFKEYLFTDAYNELVEKLSNLDFDIYYVTLYLSDTALFEERLKRDGKAGPDYAKYKAENSIKQQKVYLEMADELKEKYKNIKVIKIDTNNDISKVKEMVKKEVEF